MRKSTVLTLSICSTIVAGGLGYWFGKNDREAAPDVNLSAQTQPIALQRQDLIPEEVHPLPEAPPEKSADVTGADTNTSLEPPSPRIVTTHITSGNKSLAQALMSGNLVIPEPSPTLEMSIDEATQYVRDREPVDMDWATTTEQDITDGVTEMLTDMGSSATNIECRTSACLLEWYSSEPILSDGESLVNFMSGVSKFGGVSALSTDPDDSRRGLLVIDWADRKTN